MRDLRLFLAAGDLIRRIDEFPAPPVQLSRSVILMVVLSCAPGPGETQVLRMDSPAVIRTLQGPQHSVTPGTELVVIPVAVRVAGEESAGVLAVVSEPQRSRLWWRYVDTRSRTPHEVADWLEESHWVHSTPERLVVFALSGTELLTSSTNSVYRPGADIASTVRALFDARSAQLAIDGFTEVVGSDGQVNEVYDFYERNMDLIHLLGWDFFVPPGDSRMPPAPTVESIQRDGDTWRIRLRGWAGQRADLWLSRDLVPLNVPVGRSRLTRPAPGPLPTPPSPP